MDEAPSDRVDLEWLLGHLEKRSFGLLLLILAIAIVIPGLGVISCILICFPAVEMVLARKRPSLPRVLTKRPIATHHFVKWAKRSLPILEAIERFSRPRWHTPVEPTKRAIGVAVFLLAVSALLPIPLINILPALTIAMMAIGYLQNDGLMLAISFAIAIIALVVFGFMAWESAGALEHMMRWTGFSFGRH
jgi:hypothetical protein